ncbi:hypothetical protein HW115_03740 [Verrucomicrobiaceae bacterium N1E253]|uniref:Uncharacterized protein n=1 Tax=Oceaniferula marina TaxID=2748318 RepID=A0A851GAC7_9BACT|nr:hypothetical protein [Oceaniferula marina]NWK54708.1 hypothetical protein [Oceaniferula marina]
MSEYQCYQWKKVSQSLSPKQYKEVSNLSSHISVTSNSAEVTYHWGDFKHDPQTVLTRYFDIFLYEANWGTQRVEFRFDIGSVDVEQIQGFALGNLLEVKQTEDAVFVEVWFEENWIEPSYSYYDQYEDTGDWRLEAFEAVYRQIQQGDYRGLFLLWMKGCEISSIEKKVVALPRGMAKLEEEHRILADFVGVNEELIKQAAERSRPLPRTKKVEKSLDLHLPKLSIEKKEDYVKRLLSEDAHSVQSELKRELRKLGGYRQSSYLGGDVCYDDLANAAKREARLEAQRMKEEKERRRKEYLLELGNREDELLDRIHELVSEKKTKSYEEAVLLLRGLEDLWVSRDDREYFIQAVKCIANEFPRLTGFRGRLEKAGWLEPAKMTVVAQNQRERWLKQNPLDQEINFKLL